MRFAADPDAVVFAQAVRRLLEEQCDAAALRAAWDSQGGRVPGLWGRLAELGVTGLTVPEAAGGLDLPETDLVAILIETGRAALPEPVVETLAGARLLAGVGGPVAEQWLPRVAGGEVALALGAPGAAFVTGAEWADLLMLVAADGAVHAVPRDAVEIVPQPSVDHGARIARVTWSPAPATALGGGDPEAAVDLAMLLVAAQLVGLAEAMLEMAVRYAGQRQQFGRPIGAFQAVKHALADVYVAVSFARPVVDRAGWSVSRRLVSRGRDVSHAKHAATVAARLAARTALQVHGGIGYTFEHELHMWLKRTWTLTSLWGDAAWHRARVARSVLDQAGERVPSL